MYSYFELYLFVEFMVGVLLNLLDVADLEAVRIHKALYTYSFVVADLLG